METANSEILFVFKDPRALKDNWKECNSLATCSSTEVTNAFSKSWFSGQNNCFSLSEHRHLGTLQLAKIVLFFVQWQWLNRHFNIKIKFKWCLAHTLANCLIQQIAPSEYSNIPIFLCRIYNFRPKRLEQSPGDAHQTSTPSHQCPKLMVAVPSGSNPAPRSEGMMHTTLRVPASSSPSNNLIGSSKCHCPAMDGYSWGKADKPKGQPYKDSCEVHA